MSEEMKGSCLCGAVMYRLTVPVKSVVNCHCNICKKITGAAFETIAVVREEGLEIDSGGEKLSVYQISENAKKHFCRICGTPIYNVHKKYPGWALVQVGSLDEPHQVAPAINIFCESMLPWVKQLGELPCFDQSAS